MAMCGIPDYDILPARVGTIDVDYLRYRLHRCDNPWPPIIRWFGPPSNPEVRKEIVYLLDKAVKQYGGESNEGSS